MFLNNICVPQQRRYIKIKKYFMVISHKIFFIKVRVCFAPLFPKVDFSVES